MKLIHLIKSSARLAGSWWPSAMFYGGNAGLALLYFTDWKLILQYVPIYRNKFNENV